MYPSFAKKSIERLRSLTGRLTNMFVDTVKFPRGAELNASIESQVPLSQ